MVEIDFIIRNVTMSSMKKFGKEIETYLFDEYVVLGLHKDWINAFGELPKFETMLDSQGRLILKSTKSIKNIKSIQ